MSQRPQAIEETLKEVRRCTRNGIKINTFMMARDPSLVAFAKLMTQINKGRAFFASASGQLGRYVLVDYMNGKSKVI
jgi:Ca-activated chloride channel family protein